jgi:hypothetical protein
VGAGLRGFGRLARRLVGGRGEGLGAGSGAHRGGQGGQAVARTPQALAGLRHCAAQLAGRRGLVFLVSDFHGMGGEALAELLDLLAPACVLPVIVWDPAETEPPETQALLALSDAETGLRRTLWLREPLREQWRDAVAARRAELRTVFEGRSLPPFELLGLQSGFDAEALTRHFMECVA